MLRRKRRPGTRQTKEITILNDVISLFVLSTASLASQHGAFCGHVTVSCKGPITASFKEQARSVLNKDKENCFYVHDTIDPGET